MLAEASRVLDGEIHSCLAAGLVNAIEHRWKADVNIAAILFCHRGIRFSMVGTLVEQAIGK